MKLKLLSIFFVVLIAQTQVAQGSPLLNLSGIMTTGTTTVTNTINSMVTLFGNVLNSVVTSLGNVVYSVIMNISSGISNSIQIIGDGVNLIDGTNAVSSIITAITNTVAQQKPLVNNTLAQITEFSNAAFNIIQNKTTMYSNPIDNINQAIMGISGTLASANYFEPTMNLISQANAKAGEILPSLTVPIQTILSNFASTIPATLSSCLNTVNIAISPAENVLNAAANLTGKLAAQIAAGSLTIAASTVPITTSLTTPVKTIANFVYSVPATINNAINALQNSSNSFQTAFNAAYQKVNSELAKAGSSKNVLNSTASIAADISGKAVSCITKEIYALQDFLDQYQNLGSQYQLGIATNSFSVSTLQQTIQNTVNYELRLLTIKYRIESCLAIQLLSGAGSFISQIAFGAGGTTTELINFIALGNQIFTDGANLIANIAFEPISNVNSILTNSGAQLLPLVNNAIQSIIYFGNNVPNLIAENSVLWSNPIDEINQEVNELSSTLTTADSFKPAINLIYQAVEKAGETFPTLVPPVQNILNNLGLTIPTSLNFGFNSLTTATGPIDQILNAASDVTDAVAALVAAGTQPVSSTTVPITTTLNTPFKNITNGVNNIPASINNVNTALNTSANSLQTALNGAYQKVVLSLATAGLGKGVLDATAQLAADTSGKIVSCVTSEISTLQNYLTQYQNIAAQYQSQSATNSLSISTLKQTLQTTFNYKINLLTMKFRVTGCVAAQLLNASGSFVSQVASGAGGSTTVPNSSIAAGDQIFADSINFIANTAGDPVSTVNTVLTNSGAQLLPLITNTLVPVIYFGNAVHNIVADYPVLWSNPIGDINNVVIQLTSPIATADPIPPAINLISQAVGKAGETIPSLATPILNVINNMGSTIPTSLNSGFNSITSATAPLDQVLTAASDITNAVAAQVAAGIQPVSSTTVPITTTLNTPFQNIANYVSSVPATINNVITALQNSANALKAANNGAYQEAISALATAGLSKDVLGATANLATDTTGKIVSCVTNEISTLQNYLNQFQNLAGQYQSGILTNSLSVPTLQQTIQTTVNQKINLLTIKYRISGCIAAQLLSASGTFVPLVASGTGSLTTLPNIDTSTGNQILSDSANLIANIAGDPISTVNSVLTNSGAQLLPLIDTTIQPIIEFGTAVQNIIGDNAILWSNPVDDIDRVVIQLTSPLASADPIPSAINLISQAVDKTGEIVPTLVNPAQNALNNLALNIPTSLNIGFNSIPTATLPLDQILTAAADFTNTVGAQVAAGTQPVSSTTVPITTELITPFQNIANYVSSVPSTINNFITSLQNSANTLQTASNAIYKQLAPALATAGIRKDVLDATANLAADTTGKIVSCITNEISRLQNYLNQYQNIAAQYQSGIITNSLSVSTLQQTIQTTFNQKINLLTMKYRISSCIAAQLLSASGSFIPLVASGVGGTTMDPIVTSVGDQIFTDGANLIANAVGDPVWTINSVLTNSGAQLLPLINYTLGQITEFGNVMPNFISDNQELFSNPISDINDVVIQLTSALPSADPIKPAINLISQAVDKAGESRPSLVAPVQNVLTSLGSTIPISLNSGFNSIPIAISPHDQVLTAASDVTNAIAAQVAAGTQPLSSTTVPITTTLKTPFQNIANAVSSVPATINNVITELQNSANALQTGNTGAYQQIAPVLAAAGFSQDVLDDIANLAADTTGKTVQCITNEISTLQNGLTQFQNLAAQYQFGIITNSLSISTLRQTIQTTVNDKINLLTLQYRISGCIAAQLLSASGSFIPLVASGNGGSTTEPNIVTSAEGQIFVDGANLIASAVGDPVSTINIVLTNSGAQLLPLINNTLGQITDFGNAVPNMISDNTVLWSNPISNINNFVIDLSSKVPTTDPIRPAINLISQAVDKAGTTMPSLVAPVKNVLTNFGTTIPIALNSGFNSVPIAISPLDKVLTAASDVTNAVAALVAAGTQPVSSTTVPITTTLNTPFKNLTNAVSSVPATFNNVITALQNSANALQTGSNAAYQQIAPALAAAGISQDVLDATANLAADTTGKTVQCITNEISTLQNYLALFQNLAAQYQFGTITNSLSISTLRQTIQTAVNDKINLLTMQYRISGCIAAQLLSGAGSFIPLVASETVGSTTVSNIVTSAEDQIFNDGANLIANAVGDPVWTINSVLTNSGTQLLPLINNTVGQITDFGNAVSDIIADNTVLWSNPISNINDVVTQLTSTLASKDPIQPAINLVSQAVDKAGMPSLVAPVKNLLNSFTTTIPTSLNIGFNSVPIAISPLDQVLTAASDVTNAVAALVAAGTQPVSSTTVPITTTLKTPFNNIASVVNSVPASINKTINALKDSANSLQTVISAAYQQIAPALATAGLSQDVLDTIANLAADTTGKTVACITNEIPTLQNYLTQFQNLAAQYQFGIITNSLSISTLRQTIQTTVNDKINLLTLQYRISGCIAAQILSASGSFIPLVTSGAEGSTTESNTIISGGEQIFIDGANLIANIVWGSGNPVSTINSVLTNSGAQLLPVINNTVGQITDFGDSVPNMIADNAVLWTNPIGDINDEVIQLTTTLPSKDPIPPAINLISQAVSKAGETMPSLVAPVKNVLNSLSTTIPTTLSSGFNSVPVAISPLDNVLTAASDVTNAVAALVAAGTQPVSSTTVPITPTLKTPLSNIASVVSSVPATINNFITALQNSANTLQTTSNAAYQQIAPVLATAGFGQDVLDALANLAADTTGKTVSCITNEIPILQNFLTKFQNLAGQYQFGIITNSLSISNLRQTIQTTVNTKINLLTLQYRISGCIASQLLSGAGSFIPLVASGTESSTSIPNSGIVAEDQIFNDGAILITNGVGDPVWTVNSVLTNSGSQLIPVIDNTLRPIGDYGNTVSNIIADNEALLANPIGDINQDVIQLTSTLSTADPLQSAIILISQAISKVEGTIPSLAGPLQTIITSMGSTIPTALNFIFNSVTTGTRPTDDVLTAASDVTNVLAAQVAAGTQPLSSSSVSMTSALVSPVNNLVNAVSKVPESINNTTIALQNTANSLQALGNSIYLQIASALASTGSSNNVLSAVANLATSTIGKAVSCVTNEIPTLQNYLTEFKYLTSQYQFGIATNWFSIPTLRQTIQSAVNHKLNLLSLKYRIEGCLASNLLTAFGSFIPIVTSWTGNTCVG